MTSSAWVIMLFRGKRHQRQMRYFGWLNKQSGSHLINSLLCQWSVETKHFGGFSLSLSEQLLPSCLLNFLSFSLVSVFVTPLHLFISLRSSSLPLTHT